LRWCWDSITAYLDSKEVLLALLLMLEVVLGQHLLYPLLNGVTDKEPTRAFISVLWVPDIGKLQSFYNRNLIYVSKSNGFGSTIDANKFRQ
jgi:hypothetical protein